MEALTQFLQQQKILQIAPKADTPWIANVFMGANSPEKIYFIGSKDTRYGELLLRNQEVAFATAWHKENDHTNRKGIQGVGVAEFTNDENEIANCVALHNKNYPEFKDILTPEWVRSNEENSGVWVIKPRYIKFWNDELYADDESKEFEF